MEPKYKILYINGVAERTGTSVSWVSREVAKSRKGQGTFPLPISSPKCKGRWLASDVDDYIESLSKVNAVDQTPPAKSEKQKSRNRNFAERQRAADAALARHGFNRNGGSK